MTEPRSKADWLAEVAQHAPALRDLLRRFHPVYGRPPSIGPITASGAEQASETVRRLIRDAAGGDPVARFDAALTAGNADLVMGLLSEAWFGVPESTACWGVRGFAEAVALLDDPFDDPGEA